MNKKLLIIIVIILCLPYKHLYQGFVNMNMCVDIGVCVEGTKIKIGEEIIKINEESCKKYNLKWYDDIKACKVRK